MVQAKINYLSRENVDPTTYYIPPPPGLPACSVIDEACTVDIADARALPEFDIERDGLSFIKLPVNFTDFDDDDAVRTDLYPQMEAVVKTYVKGYRFAGFDHATRRRPSQTAGLRGSGTRRQPLQRAHCDFTPATAEAMVRQTLGSEADALLQGRFAFINFWRPITGPLRDDPLAVCDPATLGPDDLVSIRHVFATGDSAIYGVRHNPAHRWIYMSDMQPDDAIAFKVFDSGAQAPIIVPHTAFSLPSPVQPIPSRESFELRVMVFYD